MRKNTVATTLSTIGLVTILLGVLAAFIIGINYNSMIILILVVLGSCIQGAVFIGFGEIIHLLQASLEQQIDIQNKLTFLMNMNARGAFSSSKKENHNLPKDNN